MKGFFIYRISLKICWEVHISSKISRKIGKLIYIYIYIWQFPNPTELWDKKLIISIYIYIIWKLSNPKELWDKKFNIYIYIYIYIRQFTNPRELREKKFPCFQPFLLKIWTLIHVYTHTHTRMKIIIYMLLVHLHFPNCLFLLHGFLFCFFNPWVNIKNTACLTSLFVCLFAGEPSRDEHQYLLMNHHKRREHYQICDCALPFPLDIL